MSAKRLEQVALATKTAFVFPGQGSQKVGMLAELAEQFSGVGQTFAEASDALGFDLWHIAQSGEGLDQTENTQPVLLTASPLSGQVWHSRLRLLAVYLQHRLWVIYPTHSAIKKPCYFL